MYIMNDNNATMIITKITANTTITLITFRDAPIPFFFTKQVQYK